MRLALALTLVAVACSGDPPSTNVPLVDEFVYGARAPELRLTGKIEAPFITTGVDADRTIGFGLVYEGKHIRVIAKGVLPVHFRAGFEAEIRGRWRDGELFEARAVLVFGPDL